jgi:hypothetical protein
MEEESFYLSIPVLLKCLIGKVHICNTGLVFTLEIDLFALAIVPSPNCKFLKLHDILGKRSRFVRKDIVDHAKLFIKVTALNFGWSILFLAVHHPVPFNDDPLRELDHL